ncbi:hypothetical protein HXZ94_09470 [Empedobacter falsenii]|uniref:hypothetical protein n=1 Tax=Empedobacter falsenii TaxID=343874 RepID=UPI002575D173|nr:hypothetical protein [Empedobacter falsenii]MDM1298732.1 hypothetical protein [Empedobacter falsenii]MDM1318658.1 hypothetical protein [Empedobacter falsenii]
MFKPNLKLILILFSANTTFAQTTTGVGIDTSTPDRTALLELSSKQINSSSTKERGFLPPRVSLKSIDDTSTIANPVPGLLIFNLANAGDYPKEVTANNFYYWNGTKWDRLVYKSVVEEAVKPMIFYIEGTDRQSFTSGEMNREKNEPVKNNVVTFSSTSLLNSKNIVTINTTTSTFTANYSGIYEFSGFVNYNPMASNIFEANNKRAFLNLKIQIFKIGGTDWDDSIGTRTNWGVEGAATLKTATLLPTPLKLNKGDMVRLVISNPFGSDANNDHCGGGNCYIGNDIANNIPTSKGLKIQLLDYNIQ